MAYEADILETFALFAAAFIFLAVSAFWLWDSVNRPNIIHADGEIEIYKNQLQELEKDLSEGKISQADYEHARVEIGRRVNRFKNSNSVEIETTISPKFVAVIVFLFGVLAIVGYGFIGSPSKLDQPFKKRETALINGPPQNIGPAEMLALLQERAKETPNDPMAHLLIGKVLIGEKRDDEAMRALQACLRREPKNAEALAELAGVIFRLNENQTDSDVESALNSALVIDPQNLTAHFYRGDILWKTGKQDDALKVWGDAWAGLAANDERRTDIIIRVLNEVSQLDVGPSAGGQGPMMAAMAAGENPQDFIKTMIARRTDRLSQNPSDIGLRLSLVRVNMMSQKKDEAIRLLEEGMKYTNGNAFKAAMLNEAKQSINSAQNP